MESLNNKNDDEESLENKPEEETKRKDNINQERRMLKYKLL